MIVSFTSFVGLNPTRLIGVPWVGTFLRAKTAFGPVRSGCDVLRREGPGLLSRYTTLVIVRSWITGTSTVFVTTDNVPECGSAIDCRREWAAKPIERPNKTIRTAAIGTGTETDAVASLCSRLRSRTSAPASVCGREASE